MLYRREEKTLKTSSRARRRGGKISVERLDKQDVRNLIPMKKKLDLFVLEISQGMEERIHDKFVK